MALTKISTDGVKDDAVTLAKQAAGTDGQIITYDASGNPVAVGPGTDGQVLTSTGAGSPPAFEDIPAAGAALTGSTNNTITTVTGANAIEGEANLTFDSSTDTLQVHQQNNGNYPALKVIHRGGANSNISAHFQTYGGTNDVVITHGGQIGINTQSPTDKLHVVGTTNLAGNSYLTNAYVSGNIYLGGTGSANALNDYEEGTYTPVLTGTGGNPTQSYAKQNGYYIKIGRFVNVSVDLEMAASGVSAGNGSVLLNLPFVQANLTNHRGISASIGYAPSWGTITPTAAYAGPNSTTLYLLGNDKDTGANFVQANQVGNGTRLVIGFSYATT